MPVERLEWQDDAYFSKLFLRLSWTHFIELMRIDDPLKRAFYELESMRNHWGKRELIRQIDSLLYERVGLSRDKEGVLKLAQEGQLADTPAAVIRDPYVLSFWVCRTESSIPKRSWKRLCSTICKSFCWNLAKGSVSSPANGA